MTRKYSIIRLYTFKAAIFRFLGSAYSNPGFIHLARRS